MLTCPHCHNKVLSWWKKALAGPALSMQCPSCGKHWGVSGWSIAIGLTFVAAFYAFVHLSKPSSSLAFAVGAGILAAFTLAQVFVVPAVKK